MIKISDSDVKEVCRIGQGEKCCAYLVVGGKGFECVKNCDGGVISARLKAGTMRAKSKGGWKGCHWEEKP